MRFIMTAKPGDHTFLFANLEAAFRAGQAQVLTLWEAATQTLHHFRWLNDTSLNEANEDVLVNLLEYWGHPGSPGRWCTSTVMTDLRITTDSVWHIMRGGRNFTGKIENETHNTLKNQGYHFEHNFGHGQQHLSVVFALVMLLAFRGSGATTLLPTLQTALQKAGSKRQLWEDLRGFFRTLVFTSLAEVWEAIARGLDKAKAGRCCWTTRSLKCPQATEQEKPCTGCPSGIAGASVPRGRNESEKDAELSCHTGNRGVRPRVGIIR